MNPVISLYMEWASDIKIDPTLLATPRSHMNCGRLKWLLRGLSARVVSETEYASVGGTDLFTPNRCVFCEGLT